MSEQLKFTKETPLPPVEQRKMVGTWLISEPGFLMTRSIEQVGDEFYLVMRMRDNNGAEIGGNSGLPLTRINSSQFKGIPPNPTTYNIDKEGNLLCSSPGANGVFLKGRAQVELWPK